MSEHERLIEQLRKMPNTKTRLAALLFHIRCTLADDCDPRLEIVADALDMIHESYGVDEIIEQVRRSHVGS